MNEGRLESASSATTQLGSPLRSLAWLGILNGLAATLGYTLASAFLRQAANDPPIWVSAIKAACTAVIFVPWLIVIAAKGQKILPPPRIIWNLVLVSIFVQVCGNVFYQLALLHIGIALAVPLTLGAMVFSGALLGRLLMGEPLSGRIIVGLSILFAAIAFLSLGDIFFEAIGWKTPDPVEGKEAGAVIVGKSELSWLWGSITAIVSGFAYAVLGLVVRQSTRHDIPLATPIVFVSVIGTVLLGISSFLFEGPAQIKAIDHNIWYAMLAAGVLNAVAFLALAKSLKILPVVYVNAINALQAIASVFIGLAWFGESWTLALTIGLILTAGGLVFLSYAASHHRNRTRINAEAAAGKNQDGQTER